MLTPSIKHPASFHTTPWCADTRQQQWWCFVSKRAIKTCRDVLQTDPSNWICTPLNQFAKLQNMPSDQVQSKIGSVQSPHVISDMLPVLLLSPSWTNTDTYALAAILWSSSWIFFLLSFNNQWISFSCQSLQPEEVYPTGPFYLSALDFFCAFLLASTNSKACKDSRQHQPTATFKKRHCTHVLNRDRIHGINLQLRNIETGELSSTHSLAAFRKCTSSPHIMVTVNCPIYPIWLLPFAQLPFTDKQHFVKWYFLLHA